MSYRLKYKHTKSWPISIIFVQYKIPFFPIWMNDSKHYDEWSATRRLNTLKNRQAFYKAIKNKRTMT